MYGIGACEFLGPMNQSRGGRTTCSLRDQVWCDLIPGCKWLQEVQRLSGIVLSGIRGGRPAYGHVRL